MERIVLAANAEADQPWVADAAADLAKQVGGQVAVIAVDELQTEMLSTMPRQEVLGRAEAAAQRVVDRLRAAGVGRRGDDDGARRAGRSDELRIRAGLGLLHVLAGALLGRRDFLARPDELRAPPSTVARQTANCSRSRPASAGG